MDHFDRCAMESWDWVLLLDTDTSSRGSPSHYCESSHRTSPLCIIDTSTHWMEQSYESDDEHEPIEPVEPIEPIIRFLFCSRKQRPIARVRTVALYIRSRNQGDPIYFFFRSVHISLGGSSCYPTRLLFLTLFLSMLVLPSSYSNPQLRLLGFSR